MAAMVHKGFFLTCLLVASLFASTVLHASEIPGVVDIACSISESDQEGSSEEGDGKARATVHHHGCHNASSLLPGSPKKNDPIVLSRDSYPMASAVVLLSRCTGPDLRPPIA